MPEIRAMILLAQFLFINAQTSIEMTFKESYDSNHAVIYKSGRVIGKNRMIFLAHVTERRDGSIAVTGRGR